MNGRTFNVLYGGPNRPSLRVLMTVDGIAGEWTYAIELGAWLVLRGVEVTFAVTGQKLRPEQRDEADSCGVRLETSDLGDDLLLDAEASLGRASEWLLGLERERRPDVVHLNGFEHAALPFQAPAAVVAHSSVASWWRAVFGTEPGAEYGHYANAVTRGLRAATRVVTPSRAMLAALTAHEPWLERELSRASKSNASGRARVIENGISPLETTPAHEKKPFVFSAGRAWDPAKNEQLLCGIASHVGWPMRLAGEPDPDESPASPGVQHLGSLSREAVLEQMRSAAIYAAPALYEPFGLAILEAAWSGCALLLSDIPSLRELWGEAATFADPRDPAAWITALRSLAKSPATRTRLALASRARAQRYSVERMGKAYLELYEGMRGERERARRYGAA